MKKAYYVIRNCIDGAQTVLVGGSTVELPNEAVSQELLETLLDSGALLPADQLQSDSPKVEAEPTPPNSKKGS